MERKQVCPQGHSKTGENLVISAKGYYLCRLCLLERSHERNNRRHADKTEVRLAAVAAMIKARREIGSKTRLHLQHNYGKEVVP
jgi:hypothetical protein